MGEGFIEIGLGLNGVSILEGVLKWSLLFSLSSEDFLGLTRTLASSYFIFSVEVDGTETLVLWSSIYELEEDSLNNFSL